MDHSENDKRFCVYVHKDQNGDIVYVGSGNQKRPYVITNRSKEHKEMFGSLIKEIVYDNLSKEESLLKEQELLLSVGKTKFNRAYKVTIAKPIEYDFVSKYLYYDETSSTFLRWKISFTSKQGCKRVQNEEAGYKIKSKGYSFVMIEGNRLAAHRVIWVLCNKSNLEGRFVIDHINHDSFDNRITNLRLATYQENSMNMSVRKDSITGVNGVNFKENLNSYIVSWENNFKRESKTIRVSRFGDKEAAFKFACQYRDLKVKIVYNNEPSSEDFKLLEEMDNFLLKPVPNASNKSGVQNVNWNKQLEKWYVIWNESNKQKSKCFNPKTLFPDLNQEEAKQKAFEMACIFNNERLNNSN